MRLWRSFREHVLPFEKNFNELHTTELEKTSTFLKHAFEHLAAAGFPVHPNKIISYLSQVSEIFRIERFGALQVQAPARVKEQLCDPHA